MDKLAMETKDITNENIEKILELFPNVATEGVNEDGKLVRAIDFEKLKQELSHNVIDGEESYDFTWVGKKEAMLEANRPIRKTLRPDKESSLHWDTTENIYIEGDNLDALKLLQESYLGKVDLIYVDPPYNTGVDLIYKNNFYTDEDDFSDKEAIFDNDGNVLFRNTITNARFHSDWCSMMFSRLKKSRSLLKDDGIFAIAIDHNELFSLGSICDEVFGEENRLGIISVVHKPEGRNQAKFFGPSNEYMFVYAKDSSKAQLQQVVLDEELAKEFNFTDEKGGYKLKNFIRLADGKYSLRENKPAFWYPIYVSRDLSLLSLEPIADGYTVYPITETGIERTWKTTKETMYERYKEGSIIAKKENDKIWIYEKLRENQVVKTHWINKKYHGFHYGTKILDDLLCCKTFDFPKSLFLMKDVIKLLMYKNGLILDFFSGSATTAHAVMQLNAEDGGNRKFIMVQLPEKTDEKSEAYKAGYKNICEIGKERIRKAGKKIQEENPGKKLDIGFRVFKVDDTNMKDVYYSPNEFQQDQLDLFESNIKENRSDEDLLYEVLINSGVELSLPHKVETIDGMKVHFIQSEYSSTPDLIVCFEAKVPETLVRTIAQYKPTKVVFRDSCFRGDSNKINIEEIFKLITPDTRVKVL